VVAFVYDRCNNFTCKFLTSYWFGLVYLFIHSVTHVTLDMPNTYYNLYITTQLIIYGHPLNITNNNTKCKDQSEVESVTASRYVCVCVCVYIYIYIYTYINIPKS
jgi:hypothetical protein